MRVLALGGAGGMGEHACRVAASLEQVTELTVTDLDASRAEQVATTLGKGVRSQALDVTDASALRAALQRADVVLNTVGPFFRFGAPILRATIEAGCSYVDICDDWEPMAEMLDLDAQARSAGVTALIGIGASPGITNLLAVLAARELDTVKAIYTGWNIEAAPPDPTADGRPSAAVVHGIRQITGTIRVTLAGRAVDERPLRRITVDYPGIGRRSVRTFGHPEAVTLPHVFAGTTSVNVTFGSRSVLTTLALIAAAVDHARLSPDRAASIVSRAERWIPSSFERALRPGQLPPIFALATGTHDGEPAAVGCALAQIPGTTMGEVTGKPMGVALSLLPATRPGVHTPEAVLDPIGFFTALAPHFLAGPDPADMFVTTRSWDPAAQDTMQATFARAQAVLAQGELPLRVLGRPSIDVIWPTSIR